MTQNKNILIIGMNPHTIDFSQPGFLPGLTAEKVEAQMDVEQKRLLELGYNTQLGLINSTTKDLEELKSTLTSNRFDAVMIGAGIRVPPINFVLFEEIINTIHQHAPLTKITFNTNPMDTLEAIKRWI